jgi:hypothetical protein
MVYLLKMVIFYSYVTNYQMVIDRYFPWQTVSHNQMASHPLIKADARFSATKKEEADSPDLDIPKAGSQKPLGPAAPLGPFGEEMSGTRFSKLCGYHCF